MSGSPRLILVFAPKASPMSRTLVVHYAEIGTKGKNRAQFERRLMAHLGMALLDVGIRADVRRVPGRLTVDLPDAADAEAALSRLSKVAGVSSVSLGTSVARDLDAISAEAVAYLRAAPPGSFKIETRRGDKTFPHDSMAVSRAVGAACVAATRRPVDVHHPAVTVRVEVPGKTCYVIGPARAGPGGLPSGRTGTLLAFLSGGIDSPVAAWKMMRRGARVVALIAVDFRPRHRLVPRVMGVPFQKMRRFRKEVRRDTNPVHRFGERPDYHNLRQALYAKSGITPVGV